MKRLGPATRERRFSVENSIGAQGSPLASFWPRQCEKPLSGLPWPGAGQNWALTDPVRLEAAESMRRDGMGRRSAQTGLQAIAEGKRRY
jgi:hypothetical protein